MDYVPLDFNLVNFIQRNFDLNLIILAHVPNEGIISQAVAKNIISSDMPIKLAHADFEFSCICESLQKEDCRIYDLEVASDESIDFQISQIIKNYLGEVRRRT